MEEIDSGLLTSEQLLYLCAIIVTPALLGTLICISIALIATLVYIARRPTVVQVVTAERRPVAAATRPERHSGPGNRRSRRARRQRQPKRRGPVDVEQE